ncbi:hypothetical protein GCM10009858_24620 [Terrabacter carboxydivorans]|uniref:DUF4328 domain-containing protein n=2 Tax=Terrabacter carboxydivorans TaxID=619730 RepID=A0ABP5YS80_9MICO
MGDRGLNRTTDAGEPMSVAPVVPDDRPRRVEQPRLRRPALWSLGLGAASLVALSVYAFLPPEKLQLSSGSAESGWTVNLAAALFVAAGCVACVWLVRLQWLLGRAGRVPSVSSDLGLWIMWGIPLLSWVLPVMRISRWDKAIHGHRSWTPIAWAVLWVPFSAQLRGSRPPGVTPDPTDAWGFVALNVATFALWAATVLRLTRGAEVVAHQTGADA